MKLYSPFLFALLFIIGMVSCTGNKNTKLYSSPKYNKISCLLARGTADSISPRERLKALEEAHKLTLEIGNDSLLYKVVANKTLLANEHFPEISPDVLGSLYKIVAKKKDKKHFAYYESRLADYLLSTQQYDSAYKYYNDSNLIYKEEKDSLNAGYNFVKIAWIYMLFNDYNSTEENATEALKILKNTKYSDDYSSNIHLSLGNAFLGLKQYDRSIDQYEKASKFTADRLTHLILENNIAAVEILKENYGAAIKSLSKIKQSRILAEDPKNTAAVLDNLGYAKFKNGDKTGIIELKEAMQLNKDFEDQLANSYLHLSEYYTPSHKSLAIEYAHKAYTIATENKSTENRIDALNKLFSLTSGETSIKYAHRLNEVKDSIVDVRSKQNNNFALMKYDVSRERTKVGNLEKQNEIDNLERDKENLTNYIILSIIVFTGILLYYISRARHRREKLKEIYNTETRISKKLHDELANDVYNAMTFAETKELVSENKESLVTKLEDIYSRTRNISKENASINTGPEFGNELREMIAAYSNAEATVIINGFDTIDWNTIEPNKKIALFRVTQELFVNMKKHSQCTFAVLTIKKIKNNLQIDYSDNGVGQVKNRTNLKNGLHNVENRIHAIKGTVTFDNTSDTGFKLSIVFPI